MSPKIVTHQALVVPIAERIFGQRGNDEARIRVATAEHGVARAPGEGRLDPGSAVEQTHRALTAKVTLGLREIG